MGEMQDYVVAEFVEEYHQGHRSRADLDRALTASLGAEAASRVLAEIPVLPERRQRRALPTAPIRGGAGTKGEDVKIPISGGELRAYLARPEGNGPHPAILAIHENKGLVDHIRDVANRLASEGYVVLAPDLLSREGGTDKFTDVNDATAALGKADAEQNTRDLVAAIDWLGKQQGVDSSRIGVTGWCMGGGYTWRVATQAGNRIHAAVPWYGPVPQSDVDKIAAPVFAIYAGLDERINAGIGPITQQMQAGGKSFDHKVYPNAQHAFNNDQNPERYNAEQAKIAWGDMLRFFQQNLKS
jgi:carboxymethylenebutenolidase